MTDKLYKNQTNFFLSLLAVVWDRITSLEHKLYILLNLDLDPDYSPQ